MIYRGNKVCRDEQINAVDGQPKNIMPLPILVDIKMANNLLTTEKSGEMATHPGLTRSTQKEGQFRLSYSLHNFRLRRLGRAGSRNAEVLRLIDVSAAGPRIKRRDQSQELALQYEFVVPRPPALCAASFVLIVVFLLTHTHTHTD